jgi:two-component system chemotaxis response regulator CheB
MLVDDSAIIRGFMRRWIEEDGRVDLVKVCADGAQAVAEAAACKPDVIILDIEMPNMDGLTALPQLRRLVPDARIVMASTLTSAGAAQTVKALALGAADYIAKPQTSQIGGVDSYRKDLLDKIVALGERSSAPHHRATPRGPGCCGVHWRARRAPCASGAHRAQHLPANPYRAAHARHLHAPSGREAGAVHRQAVPRSC